MTSIAEFECDCKARTMVDYKVPEMFKPILHDVKCRGCGTVWEMRFRYSPKGTLYTHRIKAPTQKLADILLKKKTDALLNAPVKKSPIIIVPNMGAVRTVSTPIKKNF